MIYINKTSSISYSTEENGQFPSVLDINTVEQTLQTPVYKELISPGLLRRMSPVVRMGVACANRCLEDDEQPDGIVVGTGLGCLKDTEKFLVNFVHSDDGTLSPTSFIQSTHNTIAGQIALISKNHGYNMTHVQNGLSFETALLDVFTQIQSQEADSFIVGAVDEKTPILETLAEEWGIAEIKDRISEGASFFKVSTQNKGNNPQLLDVHCINSLTSIDEEINNYLSVNNIDRSNCTILGLNNSLKSPIASSIDADITPLCGMHFSNGAFGMHLATSLLSGTTAIPDIGIKEHVLVVNNYMHRQLGFVLIKK